MEWHRDQKKFIARGDVIATQGKSTLRSDTVSATYNESAEGKDFQLSILTADGDVEIKSEDGTATGDHAVYDVTTSKAQMTGSALKLVTPTQTVTARDKFEYDITGGKLSAYGDAKAVEAKNTISADVLSAIFAQGTDAAKGASRELKMLEAEGNVVIVTPTETLSGDKGVYNKQTNIAELNGNVKIKREDNVLEGSRATVNLLTNVSTLFGGTQAGGRVRGVFHPGKKE